MFRYTPLSRKYLRHSTVIKMKRCIYLFVPHFQFLPTVHQLIRLRAMFCTAVHLQTSKSECTFLSNAPKLPKGRCCLKVPATTDRSAASSKQISTERCWNDNDTTQPTYSDINLSQCHFVHHKSHMGWPHEEIRASASRSRRLTGSAMAQT